MKSKKAVTKRFKITGSGKILRRRTRQDHYNAKQTGKSRRAKRKMVEVTGAEAKIIRRYLSYL